MSYRFYITVLAALMLVAGAAGQVLNMDLCRFKGDEGRAYVELFVDLPRAALTHRADSTGWLAAVTFSVEIVTGEQTLAEDRWQLTDRVTTAGEIGGSQRIRDARSFQISPGSWTFHLTAMDSVSRSQWSANQTLVVEPFPDDRLALSDIELGSYIMPPDLMPQFDRGKFALVPNPARLFQGSAPHFYYYVEVYAPAKGGDSVNYTIDRTICNGLGRTVQQMNRLERRSALAQFADVDSVSLAGLGTGSYTFNITIAGGDSIGASRQARFFIYGSEPAMLAVEPQADSAAVNDELHRIDFLLVNLKHKPLNTMTTGEKKVFLDEFWRRYDDDPSTPEVPARRLLEERVAAADDRFSTARQEGHLTDRGRVVALYGEPSNRELHPIETGAKPYEIWYYDGMEGGVSFVFVDRSGLGEYSLVHSDRKGEIKNPDWYRQYVDRSASESGR
jgi:GWxTD domain-containing protein